MSLYFMPFSEKLSRYDLKGTSRINQTTEIITEKQSYAPTFYITKRDTSVCLRELNILTLLGKHKTCNRVIDREDICNWTFQMKNVKYYFLPFQ